MRPETLHRLTRRVELLEEAARRDAERVAEVEREMSERLDTPQGRAILAELDLICSRVAPGRADNCEDLARQRQALLQDPRACELLCRLAEVQAGVDWHGPGSRPPDAAPVGGGGAGGAGLAPPRAD